MKFIVVKDLMAYNVIIERPSLNSAKDLIVTHLMLMKFETYKKMVGTIYGDQHTSRACYLTTLNLLRGKRICP